MGFIQTPGLIGNAVQLFQNAQPVDHRSSGPYVRREVDRTQHLWLRATVAPQRFKSRKFAHVQVGLGRPKLALDAAFHKSHQARQHRIARGYGQFKTRFMRGGQNVGGQAITAARAVFGTRREVACQAVAVQISGHRVGHLCPHLGVLQAHRFRYFLFQANERVGLKIAPHARQRAAELGLYGQHQAAAFDAHRACGFRHCVRWCGHGQSQAAFQLLQRRLHDANRHGGGDDLREFHAVFAAARRRALLLGRSLPRQADRVQRHVDGPDQFGGRASCNHHVLRRQNQGRATQLRARRGVHGALQTGPHFHLARGRVAQRQHGAELVTLTHQWRQARQHLQVLRHADRGAAVAKLLRAVVGNGHQLEAGERIIQRHVDLRFAVGVQHHAGLPQQQRVKQLAGATAATAAAGRHGLAAVVAAADDFTLRGAGFHAPGALLNHGAEQVPTRVSAQRQQAFVHGRKRHLGARQRLAFEQHFDARLDGLTHCVLRLIGRNRHLQFMRLAAHLQCRHTQLEGGLGQIHHGCGRLVFAALKPKAARPVQRLAPTPGEQ